MNDYAKALEALDKIFLTICPTMTWPEGTEQHQGRITLEQFNDIRSALEMAQRVEGLERQVKSLKQTIAKAAICLIKPNAGIKDTIWVNDYCTLYELLVAELSVDLIGALDKDIKTLEAFRQEGE